MNRRELLTPCCIAALLGACALNPTVVLGEETVALKIQNLTGKAISFGIATEERADKGQWTRISIGPRQTGTINLVSAGEFVLHVGYETGAFTSGPIALKEFIREHPGFVLQLTAESEALSEGRPGQRSKPKYRTVLKGNMTRPGLKDEDLLNMTLYRDQGTNQP